MNTVTIDGVEYYQPKCHCKGAGHICYLRPTPQTINIPIDKLLAKIDAQMQLEPSSAPK